MTHLFHGLRNPRNTGAPRAPLVCMEEAARNLGLKTRQSLQAMIQASEIPAPKPRMESVGRHKKNYYAMSDWRDWFAKAKGGAV